MDAPPPSPAADAVLAAMVGDAAQPALVLGPDGTVRHANARAAEALGAEAPAALIGRPGPAQARLRGGGPVARAVDELARLDGTPVRVASVAVPFALAAGTGVAFAFTDVVEADDDAARRNAPPRLASLRRVATDVAEGAAAVMAFCTAALQIATSVELPLLHVVRFDPGDALMVIGTYGDGVPGFALGARCAIVAVPGGAELARTRAAVRVEDLAAQPGPIAGALRAAGIGALAWVPIVVDGQVWGALLAGHAVGTALAADVEQRLTPFASLVASRAAGVEGRAQLTQLVDEQAALRRVATLVARDVGAEELLAAVTREIGLLLGIDLAYMSRYEADGTAVGVATWSLRGDPIPLDLPAPDDGEGVPSRIWRTGRPAQRSGYADVPGPIADHLRRHGITTAVGAPLFVDTRLWGVLMVAVADDARLPRDVGARVADFAELVATAISNIEARAARARLTDEQVALRRIATLVAQDAEPQDVFDEVTATVGRLLGADFAGMGRFESDEEGVRLSTWAAAGDHPPMGRRWPLHPETVSYKVKTTGRPARVDDYSGAESPLGTYVRDVLGSRSLVGSPIVVGGRVWGVLLVHSRGALAADTAERLVSFSELVATAVANSQARTELSTLAAEQAALRRVATLVAHEAPADTVLAAVSDELAGLMWGVPTQVVRFDDDGDATVLAGSGDAITPAGQRVSLEGDSVSSLVRRSGQPERISADRWSGSLGEYALSFGLTWGAGAPIVVDGRVWGAMTVVTRDPDPFPPDTEQRLARFAELVAAAISNVEARERLAASRARVVVAADEERRRVVRDLHDGAQQRLVHAIVTLRMALRDDSDRVDRALVAEGLEQAERAKDELRALARGILPAALVRGGLDAGVRGLAELAPVPVAVDVLEDRLPAPIEATAYFIIAEALTNVAKHARATAATVTARVEDGTLCVRVADDGVGGARPDGSGLVGVADRLAAHDGRLELRTPAGGGTELVAAIPLGDA